MGRYSAAPALDTEAHHPRPGATSMGVVSGLSRQRHVAVQAGARAHDQLVEQMRTTGQTKDRDRIYPRPGTGQMRRRAGRGPLVADEPRLPLTARQARLQQHSKRAAQSSMPLTERNALAALVGGDRSQWESLNEALIARGHGRAELSADQARQVGRVDRAVRRFEKANDRSHRVYAALDVDPEIALEPAKYIQPGQQYTLDGYTAMDHSPHKVADSSVMLELTGSRGMYLGGGDPDGPTQHLMPRGITFEVDGVHDVDVVTDHGTVRRRVVQAHLIDQEDKQ